MNAPTDQHLRQLDAARERMDRAKHQFTIAAEAGIRGDKDAADKASAAFRELESARAELRRLTDMAPGPWAEMARITGQESAK